MNVRKIASSLLLLLIATTAAAAKDVESTTAAAAKDVEVSAQAMLNVGSGEFAPYYIASNRHGAPTQQSGALMRADIGRRLDLSKRFSWGFGFAPVANVTTDNTYLRFVDGHWRDNPQGTPHFWLQQCYAEVKWRQVFATAGAKERGSALLNSRMSSGDIVESGNARPIPELRAGFVDFQDIPFTRGALQIEGVIAYGKFTDDGWLKSHFNYFNYHLNNGEFFTYKRCYFRTDPRQPLSATFGMQTGGEFGGTVEIYKHGAFHKTQRMSRSLKTFLKMFIPTESGSAYYEGSSLGSWDVMLRYRFHSGSQLKAYMQKPWEDGSGIGMLNGFDGLWGLEFENSRDCIVKGAVIEYIDFTNQSGPLHWDYVDEADSDIRHHSDGGDDYYNNHQSRSYANYGMAIGTPFLRSPLYNLNGSLQFLNTRCRGFHVGIEGRISPRLTYRAMCGYRKSWGNGRIPLYRPLHDTSAMIELDYSTPLTGLSVNAQIAIDRGTLYGNALGTCVTVAYAGNLSLAKVKKGGLPAPFN